MKALINDHLRVSHNIFQTYAGTVTGLLQGGIITMTGGSAFTLTLPTPLAGIHDGLEITYIAASAQAHVLNFGSAIMYRGVTDSTAKTTATLTNLIGASITVVAFNGNWYLKASVNTVTYA